jgi:hypothetical protein
VTFWRLLFANATGAVALWILVRAIDRQPVNFLWVVATIDLASMVYMWSPNGFVAPISWIMVAYFGAQAILWVTDEYRRLDGHSVIRPGLVIEPDGSLASTTVVARLVCERDLRISMFLMTLGMAYMFAATQLLI